MKHAILSIIFIAMSITLSAQSLPFVNISEDPAAFGRGGATLASDANPFSASTNPAAITLSEMKGGIAASALVWQPSTSGNSQYAVSGFTKIGNKFGLGISGKYFSHSKYNITDSKGSVTSQFAPAEIAGALALSYRALDFLSVGANVRFINSKLAPDGAASAVSADFAVMTKFDALNISAAVTNLGSDIDYGKGGYPLPAMAKVGVAYNLAINEDNRISVNAEGDYLLKASSFMAGAGLEYCHKEMVSFRAGYHYGDGVATIGSYASVGLGLKLFGLSLNAAYLLPTGNSVLKNSVSVSLGFEF